MSDYAESELEGALRRAFVDHRADFIVIDSRKQVFQIASADLGINRGWLKGEWHEEDEQSTALVCRLTPKGRKHFGMQSRDTDSRGSK